MKVLGVDPGLQVTGYGVVTTGLRGAARSGRIELVEAGVIRTTPAMGIAERLRRVHDGLSELIEELSPVVIAIEKLYAHYKHPATAILMAHVRGVVCLLSAEKKVALASVAATHVKKSLTGHGHAGKHQIQRMVQHELSLKTFPDPPDVADALAIAIAHITSLRYGRVGA